MANPSTELLIEIKRAFENNILTSTYTNVKEASIIQTRIIVINDIILQLKSSLREHSSIKVTVHCRANLLKNENIIPYLFKNEPIIINATEIKHLEKIINLQFDTLENRIIDASPEGSNNVFIDYDSVIISIIKNTTMSGSSFIELPAFIRNKKAVINVKNNDDFCIIWSILASLYPPKGGQKNRVSDYKKHFDKINRGELKFPLQLNDIPKFEKLNNLAINVFGYSYQNNIENYYPLHLTENKTIKPIELLFIESEDLDEQDKKTSHYALIKNFSRLVQSSINSNREYEVICRRCIVGFTSNSSYEKHLYYCTTGNSQCVMPKAKDDDVIEFKKANNKFAHPIVITADFEAILSNVDEKISDSSQEIKRKQHIISSAAFCVSGVISEYKLFRGERCLEDFIEGIVSIIHKFNDITQKYPKIDLTKEELDKYTQETSCWICEQPFSDKKVKSAKGNEWKPNSKVIDHDHMTGRFLGAAHNTCNFRRQTNLLIPIYFHNLSRYDSHLMITMIGKFGNGNMKIIPSTEEEYISFSKMYSIDKRNFELRFLDSFRLMPESLDELSSNLLQKDKTLFKNLLKFTSPEEQAVIFWNENTQANKTETIIDHNWNVKFNTFETTITKPRIKGIYPYSFTDSFEKFNHSDIITKEQFHDDLNMKDISEEEYNQYLKVWNSIPDVNLGKYSDLYLKLDVLTLADVLEEFRKLCLEAYALDPCYYYTTPGLSWDACMKCTGVKLELLTDYRMLQIIEHGIRGGISGVTGDRYIDVETKNYLTNPEIKSDDPNQEWLLYVDANNLYGYSMIQKLPQSNFKWLNETEISQLDSRIRNNQITGDEDIGYVLSIDLTVPNTKKFENFPLAPETKIIESEQLSEYSKSLFREGESYLRTQKLILDFKEKKKYTIHIKNLLLYYKLGAQFTINEVISFNQSNWLQIYIDYNTEMRKKAVSDFEINFFKLMNNSMFGKTMEAIRKRIDIKLCDSWRKAKFYIRKPTFDYLKIFNENLVAIHMRKSRVLFNKPIIVGFSVLELSKHYMFDCYYNKIQPMFKEVKLTYIDCDSFVLHIEDSNIYKILQENQDLFDFSNYPKDHILYSNNNKKVIGKFKDECSGNIMIKRVSLKSKMYSHQIYLQEEGKRAKGIKTCVVKKRISFQDYYNCLFDDQRTKHTFQHFKSINHQIFTIESIKSGLSPFDSKRYYINNIESIPFN